jgi:predicted nucleic acid-binding Zn finger protein
VADPIVVAFPSTFPVTSPLTSHTTRGGMSFRPASHHAPGVWTFYVSSESTDYVVQHIRRRGMNRWQCTCPNFFFRCVARRRHCKHIRLVRYQFAA